MPIEVSIFVVDFCLLTPSSMAVLEAEAEVASAASMADNSTIPLVIRVSDLANIAIGIQVLKPAKLDGNSSNS